MKKSEVMAPWHEDRSSASDPGGLVLGAMPIPGQRGRSSKRAGHLGKCRDNNTSLSGLLGLLVLWCSGDWEARKGV